MTASSQRPRALVLISSANELPLSSPAGQSLDTGWFLVELAAVLSAFADSHDFVLATPDGSAPTLDINGLALNMQAGSEVGSATAKLLIDQGAKKLSSEQLRQKYPALVARRTRELALLREHLGGIPVSANLPNTDPEAAELRESVAAELAETPRKQWLSIAQLLQQHHDPDNSFSLQDLDFLFAPGGHAPMVDFHNNPEIGELLHTLRENRVPIALICHAPVALTSTKYRIDEAGEVTVPAHNPFAGAYLTTVPKHGQLLMTQIGYLKLPGTKTRVEYYVDEALKDEGFRVKLTANPAKVRVVWDPKNLLLTGNGPQSVDAQTAKLTEIVAARRQRFLSKNRRKKLE